MDERRGVIAFARRGGSVALALVGLATGAAVSDAGSAAPGPGSLDSSFGGNGWSSAGFPTNATAVGVQRDGKIVVAGYAASGLFFQLAVARITANGVYDSSFG